MNRSKFMKEEASMTMNDYDYDYDGLKHTRWDCKYRDTEMQEENAIRTIEKRAGPHFKGTGGTER